MRNLILAALLGLAPAAAHAHAILIASTPADGGSIPAGDRALSLRYNSRIDHALSRLTLQGTNATAPLPIAKDSAPDALSSKATLTPGTYVIHWQVLAVDGHMTRGDVRFNVTPSAEPGATPPQPKAP